jgi:hypothetical protein
MVNGSLTGLALTSGNSHTPPGEPVAAMIDAPNIPSLNGLVELGHRDGVDIRPTLLRVMTDLYVQKPVHSEEEERHYTELALRLVDLVDASTRSIVADKIARYPNAPTAVRRRLLQEPISAGRPDAAAEPFAGSKAAADELSELFFAASAEERRLILLNLPYATLPPAAPIPGTTALEANHRLELAALEHNGEAFARELERTLAISRAQARRLMDDTSGEPIVVAAVALGMPAAVLQRILLCLNPVVSRSVQRVYDLALLQEEIEPDTALRLLAIWQASRRTEKKSTPARTTAQPPQPRAGGRGQLTILPARPRIRWDEHAQTHKTEGA